MMATTSWCRLTNFCCTTARCSLWSSSNSRSLYTRLPLMRTSNVSDITWARQPMVRVDALNSFTIVCTWSQTPAMGEFQLGNRPSGPNSILPLSSS